jgi:hypothetical protein
MSDVPRKRLNADEKRALKAASAGKFVQQYGRKSNKRGGLVRPQRSEVQSRY